MTRKVRIRTLLIGGLFTLFFVCIIGRMYFVQVIEAKTLSEQAQEGWQTDKVLPQERGSILDTNGKALAEDVAAYTVALDPRTILKQGYESDIVQGLSEVLLPEGGSKSELENKIRALIDKKNDKNQPYAYVEVRKEGLKIDKKKADEVSNILKPIQIKIYEKDGKKFTDKSILPYIGVDLVKDKKRYYPGGTLAAQLLGYRNLEGEASIGLELKLDDVLKGAPGSLNYQTDLKGVELPDSKVSFKPPIDGNDVHLTIDRNIQYYIENALAKMYEKWHPKGATVIAADPKTMEILGMATVPNFNPNEYWLTTDQAAFRNMAVAVPYEPGSTFKVVTLAGAVEDGKFNPNDTYMSGSIQITDQTLHDHDRNGWGRITFLEGLKRSSNVAFVKLGYEMLGQDRLLGYIKKFGFGSKTNIDVPMEAEGSIPMKYPAEFATATYGQGLTVTAIQQLASYGVVANGGKLMWPHVIKDIANHKTGEIVKKFEPKVVSQVITEQTAKQVTEYLEQVVSDQKIGTGRNAYIDGYRVAGKTGTAQKVVSGGKYSTDTWIISFAGYAPVEDPKILVVIIADEPDLGGDYKLGGQVAAPAFKDIVSQSLQYMGIGFSKGRLEVKQEQAASAIKAPDLSGMTPLEAKNSVVGSNGQVEVLGKGNKIIDQFPKAGAAMSEGQQIYALLQPQEELSMPDLKGKSLRAAMEMCAFIGVTCSTSGEGYVAEQSVAGEGNDRVVSLTLKPIGKVTESTSTPIPSASPGSDKAAVKSNNGQ